MLCSNSGALAALVATDSFLFDPDGVAESAEGEYNAAPTTSGLLFTGSGGQNPQVTGFSNAWYRPPGSSTETNLWSVLESAEGGLSHPLQDSAGGVLEFDHSATFTGFRHLARPVDAPPVVAASESIYMSVLMQVPELQPGSPGWTNGGVTVGFVSTDNDAVTGPLGFRKASEGFRVGFSGDGTNMDLIYRSRKGLLSKNEPLITNTIVDNVVPGQTYLVILKVTKDVVTGNANASDLAEIWVNPADITSESAAALPMATIYDRSLETNDALSFFNIRGSYIGGEGALFDEVRLGTTWADVAVLRPPPGIVFGSTANPEPLTVGLSALGLLAVGFRLTGRRAR